MSPFMKKVTLHVDGMHCGACGTAVQMFLSNTDGVSSATVDYDSKRAMVEFDEAKVTPENLVQGVKDIGFAANIEVTDVNHH